MKRGRVIAGVVLAIGGLIVGRAVRRFGPPARALSKSAELAGISLSKNDNDPRLDRDFNDLTAAQKEDIRAYYRRLPSEYRNDLGTAVYALGKNLTAPEDWAFLREVVAEPRCLSLADCAKGSPGAADGDDVTLAYPALVALKQAQRVLESDSKNKDARSVIEAARKSQAPAVQRLIGRLDRKFPR